ncbi:MAG: helix-turn-helix domain-containing protein [Pseudonocardiaceae bacterium]
MGPIDPEFLEGNEMRAALAARGIGTVYRLLGRLGVSQRQIAQRTGQSQPEVSEIIKGRQVCDVWVLERIADGLGVPRARMGLSYGEQRPDAPSAEEVDGDMRRRALLATTTAAALGQAFLGLTELTLPSGQPLPARLDMSHVHTVAAVTERLRGIARYYGGQADLFGAAATLYTRWMQVPATEVVKAGLAAALAELHTEAGWCSHDAGVDGTGYFTRALRLAGEAGDTYGIANAALHAGVTLVRSGHPNDALKLFQLGQFHLGGSQHSRTTPTTPSADDPRIPTVTARLARQSATAYAVMGGLDQATRCLAEAHEGWVPRDAFERAGADFVTAGIQLDLGRLDAAEQSAASALRSYGESHRRGRTLAELLLAEVHVRAGEPQGLTLAHQAIEKVRPCNPSPRDGNG